MFDTLIIGLSLLSGGMACKAIMNAFGEIRDNSQRMKEINDCPKFYKQSNQSVTKGKKEEKRLVYVEVEAKNIKQISQSTFSRKYNTLNPQLHYGIFDGRFLSSCCGKEFNFRNKNYHDNVVVDIRDCSIHRELLLQKEEKVFLQAAKNASELSPTQYVSYLLSMRTGLNLAIIGTVSYDFTTKNWQLLPSFLMRDMGINLNLIELKEHFQSLNSNNRALIFIYSVILFALLAVNNNRISRFFVSVSDFFTSLWTRERGIQNITVARTKGSQKLKCLCGKNMEALLGCGHLSQCVDCYEKDKTCPICRKHSRTYSKIFM